jgi:large subunit ribosomal protein L6
MSRIGKSPIPIPDGIKVNVAGDVVEVSSADGKKKLSQEVTFVSVKVADKEVVLERDDESRDARARHGLYRTLIANMIEGITKGWQKELEIHGAGYKVEQKGRKLVLTVGYTFPREFQVPAGIDVELPTATHIVLKGIDKAVVGQVAASIRSVRPADPYKGKGIRYKGEQAIRKTPKGK